MTSRFRASRNRSSALYCRDRRSETLLDALRIETSVAARCVADRDLHRDLLLTDSIAVCYLVGLMFQVLALTTLALTIEIVRWNLRPEARRLRVIRRIGRSCS